MEKNVLARKFWESSIAKFTGQPAQSTHFVKDGVAWHRFSLDSRRSFVSVRPRTAEYDRDRDARSVPTMGVAE
jgi:hypothetical protein